MALNFNPPPPPERRDELDSLNNLASVIGGIADQRKQEKAAERRALLERLVQMAGLQKDYASTSADLGVDTANSIYGPLQKQFPELSNSPLPTSTTGPSTIQLYEEYSQDPIAFSSKYGNKMGQKMEGAAKSKEAIASAQLRTQPQPTMTSAAALAAKEIPPNARIVDLPRDASGPKPPSGYMWSADGRSQQPIPGGPADRKLDAEEAKKESAKAQSEAQAELMVQKIDEALSKVGVTTTGFIGSLAGKVAGTPATDLRKVIDTLKANMSFQTLQEMRANSPTGGALGAISDRELVLLGSTIQSLDPDQSRPQLIKNLKGLRKYFEPRAGVMSGPAVGTIEDGHRFKGGNPADPNSWEKI